MAASGNLAGIAATSGVPGFPRVLHDPPAVVRIAGLLSGIVGIAVLVGWAFDLQPMKSVWPGFVSMKVNTGLAFLLCGVSLTAWTISSRRATSTAMVRGAAVGAMLIGGASLLEYLFDCNFGIDEFFVADNDPLRNPFFPGRPAFLTAASFLLLGLALLLVPSNRKMALWIAPSLGLVVSSVAALTLLGYLYGTPSLGDIPYFSSMTVHTAATFLLLGVGVLYARPNFRIMAPLRSQSVGGIIARRLIPAVIALRIGVAWLVLLGRHFNNYDTKIAFALIVFLNITVFLCVVWSVSRALNRWDEDRRAADAASKETLKQSEIRLRLAQQAASIGTFKWNVQTDL